MTASRNLHALGVRTVEQECAALLRAAWHLRVAVGQSEDEIVDDWAEEVAVRESWFQNLNRDELLVAIGILARVACDEPWIERSGDDGDVHVESPSPGDEASLRLAGLVF